MKNDELKLLRHHDPIKLTEDEFKHLNDRINGNLTADRLQALRQAHEKLKSVDDLNFMG